MNISLVLPNAERNVQPLEPDAVKAMANRRWYQFRLSWLIILLTIAGVGFGYIGNERRLAKHQHNIKSALEKHRIQLVGGDERSRRPDWLKLILGDDSAAQSNFALVQPGFSRSSPDARDEAVDYLKEYQSVNFIIFVDKDIHDDHLRHFRSLTHIQCLDLSDTQVTGRGLRELRDMHCLKMLNVAGTSICDSDLEEVSRHSELEALWLLGTNVTDAGLAELQPLKKLKLLCIIDTKVTDDGLEKLSELLTLETIEIRRTLVTDAGIEKLQRALPKARIDLQSRDD